MSKTVLIVEDNDLNIKLFNDLLQAHGYDTVQTMDGRDVLKLAREHCPNLIVRMNKSRNVGFMSPLMKNQRMQRVPL